MQTQPKSYITSEIERNRHLAPVFERILRQVIGAQNCMIGHHLGFEFTGDRHVQNEISSADTLMFDHEIMSKIFGSQAIKVMQQLAAMPASIRDAHFAVVAEYALSQSSCERAAA